ncbi:pilus assembly PilX family protein [Lysobacter enzymogenes]|uniref:Protein PilX n=1 Tax=Lysobacter enzymogenes TaxID=69 RepID=A0A3N2RIR8_LYSEN|nr:PilX N-terminal domain-containing pilus assembly protein [Lysobacter enzymogenes]ROU07289.1 protein PilX [Lysobacter enzymogenes]
MSHRNHRPRRLARRAPPRLDRNQRGAALYVALMMLILLALIGIAALQVTSLQERMSSNYSANQMAFENAEARARERENDLYRQLNSGGQDLVQADTLFCRQAFSPEAWAQGKNFADPPSPGQSSFTRRIDQCIGGYSSEKQGQALLSDPNLVFQVTAYATDRSGNASSDSVVDTIFIP